MILAKLKLWGAGFLAVLAGIGVAIFYGYTKGKAHAVGKVRKARQAAADAKATTNAYEVREHVDEQVSKTPDAPAQKLADAAPDTAAGHLRDDGWLRDGRKR